MNLFTKYTQEEINFLLTIRRNKIKEIKDLNKIKYFKNVDKKDFEYIYIKILEKKEILDEYDLLIVMKGKIGVVDNKKIKKIIKNGEIFGIKSLINNNNKNTLIAIENSEVLLFKVKNKKSQFFYNLLLELLTKYYEI